MISEKLLNKYRYVNVEYDWWDSIYEEFKNDMDNIGIEVKEMYFNGFYFQGNGACFEGYVRNWALFLKSLGYDNKLLIEHASDNWTFSATHTGYYYHENCIRFTSDLPLPDGLDMDEFIEEFSSYPKDNLRSQSWYVILNQFDSNKLEKEFIEAFKDHMRTLYERLKEEYEYLVSDEAVAKTIITDELKGE